MIKTVKDMTMMELCAFVSNYLSGEGMPVVLVGGACVSIYSDNEYQTRDLDFIQKYSVKRKGLAKSLSKIGFTERNRYFEHPDTDYFIEFPTGPIAIGDEPVHHFVELDTPLGPLVLLSATDCCKDRLSAFYHWRDEQSLQQAINIAKDNDVDLKEIKRWSEQEGMQEKFARFIAELK